MHRLLLKRAIIIFLFLACTVDSSAQNVGLAQVDSLKTLLYKTSDPRAKALLMTQLAEGYRVNFPDSN
jgi:hypothetical protein